DWATQRCHQSHGGCEVTLVLSALTKNVVLQASDRRLVWIHDGAVTDKDDMANKAVLYCGRLAFSYTAVPALGPGRHTPTNGLPRSFHEPQGKRRRCDSWPRKQLPGSRCWHHGGG